MTKSLKKNVFLSNAQRYEMYNHYMRSMPSDEKIKKDLDLADKIRIRKEKAKEKERKEQQRQEGQEQKQEEEQDNKKVVVKSTTRPMTYEELINWAVDRYSLNRRPNKSTISRLIARIGEERASGGPERKPNVSRVQKGRFPKQYWNGWILVKVNVYLLLGP
ncbi:hypothetical protein BDC45DRAFT_149378 [Circinella umbellata]|nr:hypothetical protein BDC45DRAFT_149378 [Circinella umbellata]